MDLFLFYKMCFFLPKKVYFQLKQLCLHFALFFYLFIFVFFFFNYPLTSLFFLKIVTTFRAERIGNSAAQHFRHLVETFGACMRNEKYASCKTFFRNCAQYQASVTYKTCHKITLLGNLI